MPKRVLFYARHSSDDRLCPCFDRQNYHAKRFIKEKGWKLVLTCRDEDIGDVVFTAQPGVHKLLEEVDHRSVDVVLCHTLDRLCSSLTVAARLLHDLKAQGIELWAADPGVQIKTKDLIDYYCTNPGKPLGDGRHLEAKPDDLYEVEHLVRLPYGYRYTGAYNADRQYVFGYKVLDPEAADVVLRIFQMYADGMSPAKIAAVLNMEGVPSPYSGTWRDATIRGDRSRRSGILNDEIYIGRSWVPGRDYYDYAPALRIVSDELWRRVKLRQGFSARRAAP
ncbi:recombinase family protein [Sinorhizobium medicae]|uniref:recombinase family protein n=1 Tax=Sinorhizobium medicae TaxID=110321 RepID=UPI0004257D2E|nr:recombinase family protein [Sinorhizobium medicae]RVQ74134.1 recombinase family protein [Sinorhizobium medicae]